MFFAPKSRDSKDPSDFSRDDFTNLMKNLREDMKTIKYLFFKFFKGLFSDEFQSL